MRKFEAAVFLVVGFSANNGETEGVPGYWFGRGETRMGKGMMRSGELQPLFLATSSFD